jgi:uncharacterized membrane protein
MPAKPAKAAWSGVFVLAFIGAGAAILRMVTLARGSRAGPNLAMNDGFAANPVLTLIHIVPGLLFILLAPLQFVPAIRSRAPRLHRWVGRVVLSLALIIGVSALRMTFQMAIGGVKETAAVLLFDSLFLFCLAKGYAAARRRDFVSHREWMVRMFGIALGIATTRPVVGVFFATSRLTHLTPHEFFGTAFWIGFSTTLIAAESWVNYTRKQASRM